MDTLYRSALRIGIVVFSLAALFAFGGQTGASATEEGAAVALLSQEEMRSTFGGVVCNCTSPKDVCSGEDGCFGFGIHITFYGPVSIYECNGVIEVEDCTLDMTWVSCHLTKIYTYSNCTGSVVSETEGEVRPASCTDDIGTWY